ncbi:uncharacterized protein Dana_GF12265 [Drosophila ananassae]|uniref:Uncharacterized protein n=1 Tax=Drosophila ananassae TaxID=7217 RepID=B3MHK4_DROAN|nr:uncharacterized protein LOC6495117 [Drosophila ananassae]EDV35840.2 uncharacterized protein Dana_GF12265 [Drosophila ananassae]
MGLKRFLNSMTRTFPMRTSKPGTVAEGFPPVFNRDGMWNVAGRQQDQPKSQSPANLEKYKEQVLVYPAGSRKRSWLLWRGICENKVSRS